MTMIKKKYQRPITEVLETRPQQMLAGSIVDNGNEGLEVIISGDNDESDAIDGCAREYNDWDFTDSFLKTIVVLVMMTVGLALHAQHMEPAAPAPDGKTHAMTISQKDGTVVCYTMTQLSHVTYLPEVGIKVYLKNTTTSVDYLFSQMEYIEYTIDANINANWEKVAELSTYCPEAWRLEYPQVSDNLAADKNGAESMNQIVVKRTQDYGITYSVEWDNAKVANRWTCYQLHAGNTLSATDRDDDFKADTEVAISSTLNDYKGSGFSRGHLCPSADRLCTAEQNNQTFYLTNMQPQYQSHNGGLWGSLETLVRQYATNDNYTDIHCDTLYIVKAATISDKVTIDNQEVDGVYPDIRCGKEGTRDHALLVPKYFYMALLHYNKATDTYHALALWTKHTDEKQSVKNLGQYAITIDELEHRTGLDFFCNLPDAIEDNIESELDLDFWHLTTE